MYLGVGSKQGWNVLLSIPHGLIKEGELRVAYCQQHSKETQRVREDRDGGAWPAEKEIK